MKIIEVARNNPPKNAKRLKSKSPNAYARYERAQARPSLEKYAELLHAANPNRRPLLLS